MRLVRQINAQAVAVPAGPAAVVPAPDVYQNLERVAAEPLGQVDGGPD